MKYKIYRLVALFLLLATMSSCFMESYGKYHKRSFYGKRKKYYWHHKHRHGSW